jgi:ribonuclease PH
MTSRPPKRTDGRRADEMRPLEITTDYLAHAEGSALIELGDTRVLCAATVEDKIPPWMRNQGIAGGWVTAEYSMLPRSTPIRNVRESVRGRLQGRTQEIQRLIGRALRAVVDLEALGERTIWLDCDVIQADGGTRTAAVTGGYVALAIALGRLIRGGLLPAEVLKAAIAAVSVGVVGGQPVLDLSYEEDSIAEVDFNVVMTGEDEFAEVQGTAEGRPFNRQTMDQLIDLAAQGVRQLFAIQRAVLEKENRA